jgi:hypothetical protein
MNAGREEISERCESREQRARGERCRQRAGASLLILSTTPAVIAHGSVHVVSAPHEGETSSYSIEAGESEAFARALYVCERALVSGANVNCALVCRSLGSDLQL